jgi:hypothetical protein
MVYINSEIQYISLLYHINNKKKKKDDHLILYLLYGISYSILI